MSTYVMTDIHGCYDAMKRMLAKIGFSDGDRFYDEEQDCIFYDLDCGCVFGQGGLGTGRSEAKLACLRLEDEKVFYVC